MSEIENFLEIAELRTEIFSNRNEGQVIFEIQKLIPDNSIKTTKTQMNIVDLFVSQLGYSPLGQRWKPVKKIEAQKILTLIMTKDLAYYRKIMSLHKAEEIIVKFFDFFPGDGLFFTNATFVNDFANFNSWNAITKATFDTGIVVVSNNRIGILWVEDED